MAANKYRRDDLNVLKNGAFFCKARNAHAAAEIVDALTRAEGREPETPRFLAKPE